MTYRLRDVQFFKKNGIEARVVVLSGMGNGKSHPVIRPECLFQRGNFDKIGTRTDDGEDMNAGSQRFWNGLQVLEYF
jgi:hypothetical protein